MTNAAIIINGIRTEPGKYILSTPAGAKIYECKIHNTHTGEVKRGVIFETKSMIDICDHIPEWIKKELTK